jgi:hypothetical protein
MASVRLSYMARLPVTRRTHSASGDLANSPKQKVWSAVRNAECGCDLPRWPRVDDWRSIKQARSAFRSMQDLLEFHKLSVDELAALNFDPGRATRAQLAKGAPLMGTLSQDESNLTEQAV